MCALAPRPAAGAVPSPKPVRTAVIGHGSVEPLESAVTVSGVDGERVTVSRGVSGPGLVTSAPVVVDLLPSGVVAVTRTV